MATRTQHEAPEELRRAHVGELPSRIVAPRQLALGADHPGEGRRPHGRSDARLSTLRES